MNEYDNVTLWSNGALEYVETITRGSDKYYKVRCTNCGEVFTRAVRNIRDHTPRCPGCYKPHNKGYLRKLERAEFRRLELAKAKKCVVCGGEFHNSDERRRTCSSECAAQLKKANSGLKRFRHKGGGIIDYGITLKRVYDRDKGKCWICGGLCDFNDVKYTADGHRYCGNAYPVKDHLIPLSAGGCESWENIRLAHWGCNSEKSDAIVDVEATTLGKRLVVSERCGKKDGAIPCFQFTLDGEFVRGYRSASEASRATGIPVCQISAARTGRQMTAHGYIWKTTRDDTKEREAIA